MDEMSSEARLCDDKAGKAMVDAARLADELRAEQDHVSVESRAKRALDTQIGKLLL